MGAPTTAPAPSAAMTEPNAPKNVYETRVSGLWQTRHEITDQEGDVGVLTLERTWYGHVRKGVYRPAKGAVLTIERDPGLRRGTFSMWSEGREWLGSSERSGYVSRVFKIHTGGKPFHVVPLQGFTKGWGVHAPRTGEAARIHAPWLGRNTRMEVYKRLDFTVLLFGYFLGYRSMVEAIAPGPAVHAGML